MLRNPCLTARWSNLCLFNFTVEKALIAPNIPCGFAPDLWQGYVSIVTFQLIDTRVLGSTIGTNDEQQELAALLRGGKSHFHAQGVHGVGLHDVSVIQA